MSKYKVIELGDDSFPELSNQRRYMPEPHACKITFYKTIEPEPIDLMAMNYDPSIKIKYEEWERILVHEDGATYYIWKHLGTGLLFR